MPDDPRDSTVTERIPLAPATGPQVGSAAEVSTSEIPLATGNAAARAASPDVPATRMDARRRGFVLGAITAGAVAGLVLAFFVGTALRAEPVDPAPAAIPTRATSPTPTPTPTVEALVAVGPATVGVHTWDELAGGECFQPYVSPWEREYTVVDCGGAHAAQLTYRGAFPEPAGAPYPGDAAITSQLNLLCSASGALDLGAAAQYPDLQTQASYPAGQAEWEAGDRAYSCFVSRSSGEQLAGSLAPAA